MKKIVRYVSEIILAVFLIFISYFAWDRIDVEAYEKFITQYTLEDISISLENDFVTDFECNEHFVENSVLSINNYQDREYNANILLELNGVNNDIINNLILVIDNEKYILNELYKSNKDNDYYFLITNVNLDKYEKLNYNLKLLIKDNYHFNDVDGFSYNIIEEIV